MVSVTNNTNCEDSSATAPSPTFVSRVTSIPVVSEAFSAVNSAVNTLSEKSKYAKYALDTTNNAVNSVVNTASKYAEPYQQRFGPQISKVDETASRMLDMVEEKFPIITQPPAQVLSNARGAVNQVKSSVTSSKPVTSASNAVKNLESVLASVMDNVEVMVEKYLPEDVASQNEAAVNGENGCANGSAPNGQVARAVHISLDVQKRLARMLLAQIKQLQETIPEATHELLKMKESSHLLNTATDSIRSLNDKLTRVMESLRESGVERAKALDAQFEISNRVEPIIKSALGEVAALTDYVQSHLPGMKGSRSTAAVAEVNIEASEAETDKANAKISEE